MAITQAMCDVYKRDVHDGVHLPGHTYKCALYTSAATLGATTTAAIRPLSLIHGELARVHAYGAGMARRIQGLTTSRTSLSTTTAQADAIAWPWGSLTTFGDIGRASAFGAKNLSDDDTEILLLEAIG
jgi:hypothetical protein